MMGKSQSCSICCQRWRRSRRQAVISDKAFLWKDAKEHLNTIKKIIDIGIGRGYNQLTLPEGFYGQLGLKKSCVQHGRSLRQNSSFSLSSLPVRIFKASKIPFALICCPSLHLTSTYLFFRTGELQHGALLLNIVVLDFNLVRQLQPLL